jgi:succinoglycan biosynthesis transport protein ExoP
MELRNYINILLRRKWVIILTIVVTMIVVVIGTRLQTPIYQASTVLRIATSASGQLSYAVSAYYIYSERLMNTYLEIVTSRPVLSNLENRLALTKAPVVKAEVLPNTELIKITVEHTDPQIAAKTANTLADILIEQSAQQYEGGKISLPELLAEQLAQAKADLDQAQQAYNTLQIQTLPSTQQLDAAKESLLLKQNNYVSLNTQYEQAIIQGTTQVN